MNTKAMIPLIAGLGIAGVAGKLGYDYVKKAQGAQTQRIQLWAVMEDVPRGRAIGESDLKPLAFPAELAPPGALADKSKILGRVPHTGVPSGVPVLETMLLPVGTPPGIHVPPGLRAVAVKIDESSGVDNHLQPGCRVDVVGYFTVKTQNNRNETIARTIVENVEVAAVGQRLAPDAPERPSNDPKAKKSAPTRDKPARAATLLVTPEQVPLILLAEHRGEIKLSMRGLEDSAKLDKYETIREGDVTGAPDPYAEAEKTLAGKTGDEKAAGGLAGLVSGFFGSMTKAAGDAPVGAPAGAAPDGDPVAEAEPIKPEYEATMVIVNGTDRRTVGWVKDQPLQPIDISPDGPNIFEKQPPKRSKPKSDAKPGGNTETKTEPKKDPKPEPQPEPTGPVEEIIPVSEEETEQPKELIG